MSVHSHEPGDTIWAPIVIILMVLVVVLLLGYVFWYSPGQMSAAPPQTNIRVTPPAPAAPSPPVFVPTPGSPGPPGPAGPAGPPGPPGPSKNPDNGQPSGGGTNDNNPPGQP
jgi:hypothetical protein